jgi:hypothetical protein
LSSLGSSNYASDSEDDKNLLMGDDPKTKKKASGKNKADLDNEDNESDLKKLSNPEIVDMHLVWEKHIMMLCCNAKEYIVYDE